MNEQFDLFKQPDEAKKREIMLDAAIDKEIESRLPEIKGKPQLSFFGGIMGVLQMKGFWTPENENSYKDLWHKIAGKLRDRGVEYFTPAINDLIEEVEGKKEAERPKPAPREPRKEKPTGIDASLPRGDRDEEDEY